MKKSIISIALCAVTLCASAQLKVCQDGRVIIGAESADLPGVQPEALDTIPGLKVLGRLGDMGEGARIAIGDNASRFAQNIVVGELGVDDSDIMWLQGKHGVYFTHSPNANDTVFYYDDTRGNYMQFNCDVKCAGVFVASDESFKSDIVAVEDADKMLARLKPVQYKLKPFMGDKPFSETPVTEKDNRDVEFYQNFYESIKEGELRYGLLAQEVEEVIPSLVKTGTDGKKFVDYVGLVPLLINAVNDLSAEVETLRGEMEMQQLKQLSSEGYDGVGNVESYSDGRLSQNVPNPFSGATSISYVIPEKAMTAQICFFDLQGKMLKAVNLDASAKSGNITVTNADFEEGMYLYALIADGKEIDVKRMILTK